MKQRVRILAVSLVLILLDQLSKYGAAVFLKGRSGIVLIPGVLELSYLYPENRGMAFGLLQGGIPLFVMFTVAVATLLLYAAGRIPPGRRFFLMRLVCVLMLSGAVGNLIDRVARGYVIDFIYFSLIDFPVFNVADMFVVAGGVLLVLSCLFYYKDEDLAFLTGK